MKLLLVEDTEDTIEIFLDELKNDLIDFSVAKSKNSAIKLLQDQDFDLVVLDLQIPAIDGAFQKSEESHGLAVYDYIYKNALGTPIIVHSAYATLNLLQTPLLNSSKISFFGIEELTPMLQFIDKPNMRDCINLVREFSKNFKDLKDSVEIGSGTTTIPLRFSETVLLRRFARLRGCKTASLSMLSGGLSNAKVLKFETYLSNGSHDISAVVKIDEHERVNAEHKRYQMSVIRLDAGSYAPLLELMVPGCSKAAAVFYKLGDKYPSNVFQTLKTCPESAAQLVPNIRQLVLAWQQGPLTESSLEDISEYVLPKKVITEKLDILPFQWNEIKDTKVSLRWCVQHCDLHGANILVKNEVEPLLIDYGLVGVSPGCLDPLVLEMSLLFHPEGQGICNGWPTEAEASKWSDLDAYASGSPYEKFIRECRDWAFENKAAGTKSVYATALCHALRQLKYPNVKTEIALAVAKSAYNALNSV